MSSKKNYFNVSLVKAHIIFLLSSSGYERQPQAKRVQVVQPKSCINVISDLRDCQGSNTLQSALSLGFSSLKIFLSKAMADAH